ncbi:MAG: VWA domain-containing protein [Rhodobacterales bacterium]|nr:VWA domain-containing protein [Rhodobacterales bacterium]
MSPRTKITAVLSVTAALAMLVAPRLFPVPPPIAAAQAEEAHFEPLPTSDPVPELKARQRDVDIVLCLDTSGSMEGLLDSARSRLWDIVNRVSEKEPNARLRVALITFGSPGVASERSGFVAVRTDLTDDLDALYGQIMALSTAGGEEYVGWTLHTALTEVSWSTEDNAARIMFVAGNESADQASHQFNFRKLAAQARSRGIVVNSLYAGNEDQGIREQWAAIAEAGGGVYAAIDRQAGTRQVATPQDQRLVELNGALNQTYVGYGAKGSSGKANQTAQDGNARSMGSGSASTRISVKSKKVYDNSGWDLLDGLSNGAVDLDSLSDEETPAMLQGKSMDEKRAAVADMKLRRAAVKKEIEEVAQERTQWLKERPTSEAEGLDEAMLEAIDAQL